MRSIILRVGILLFNLVVLLTATSWGAIQLEILEVSGEKYFNASLQLENENVVRVVHRDGVARIPLHNLAENLQSALLPKEIIEEDEVEDIREDDEVSIKPSRFDKFKSLHQVPRDERFRIIEEHVIPNGGKHYKIVIAPNLVNVEDIKKIINEFREKTTRERITIVTIFDDTRAIPLMLRPFNLTEEEAEFYDKSIKAIYWKNGNTGHHRSAIHPEGLNGDSTFIEH